MNKLQETYAEAIAAYETAKVAENWDLVEELEIPMVEAEAEMVEWALAHAEQTGMIPTKELAILKDRWMFPQFHGRVVDLAFRLAI